MLHRESGRLLELNPAGAYVVELCDGEHSVSDIQEETAARHGVDPVELRALRTPVPPAVPAVGLTARGRRR